MPRFSDIPETTAQKSANSLRSVAGFRGHWDAPRNGRNWASSAETCCEEGKTVDSANKRSRWTTSNIRSQYGRLIVVTGTGGLGYECALALARAGAEIVMAGRSRAKGEASIARIRESVPSVKIHFEELDLADLASIEACGKRMRANIKKIDVLINNAAVMTVPQRQVTKDGFELQFGTNYLGHFAFTAHLMPLLHQGSNTRVVNVAALAANMAKIDFDDLQSERRYRPMAVYGQSKLANLIFSLALHRLSMARNWGTKIIATHPGLARTDLSGVRADKIKANNDQSSESKIPFLLGLLAPILLQPAEQGALPPLFAATASEAKSGQYYGPDGFGERRGFPAPAKIPSAAKDEAVAKRLWEISEQLTHVRFDA
ncbi:MAG: SDR family NAD(P)-dependent oxidoreductase [Mesorhizobium sp.]|nr:MAG: SDR family NAD(P)-dependent oxidoreductase [Mesorhizobium sp.]RWK82810.1 MAG: SDR family NAD(P)-dependent oxidoreductase [Mesorhizobium sp.]RWL06617.1 MAG: SDR family NAD(P)-dependent oxidoreductase [Mesorhizobium sp.]